MRFFITILFFIFSHWIGAQTLIKGKVISGETNKAVENISVILKEIDGKVIKSFTTTDNQGKYELEYKGDKDSISISVAGFNIKKQTKIIANISQTLDLILENDQIALKEVVIIPPKIKQLGDTLNYNVNRFADQNDSSIGDVLKKMPGIQVADNGQIFYQSKAINKFYIENMDLLKGRYGIATNNISAKDVATVQVLENHQPIKALKDKEYSDEAAINLKLKDGSKGMLLLNAQAGIGLPSLLLSNELITNRFTQNNQNILIYKGDNTGRDITSELQTFDMSGSIGGAGKILQIQTPSPPAISKQRYLFNDAHMGTLNDLRKLKEDYTLTTNIDYIFDRIKKNSFSTTDYYLPEDSVFSITDVTSAKLNTNKLKTKIMLEANTDKKFVRNELSLNGEWNRETGNSFTGDSVSQNLRNPSYALENSFDLTKRDGEKVFKIYSKIGYKDISQNLNVAPLLYGDLFGQKTTDGYMHQTADLKNFITYNSVSWGTKWAINFDFKLDFKADLSSLKSEFYGYTNQQEFTADSLSNDLRWNTYEWSFTPMLSHQLTSRMKVMLQIPLQLQILSQNDRIIQQSNTHNFFYVDPRVFVNYKFSAMWNSTLTYNYSNSISDIQSAYTGFIMSSYRNLLRNDGKINKRKTHSAQLFLNHKNPLTTLFASMLARYSNSRANLLNDYEYQGILRIKSSIVRPNTSQNFVVSANIGKDISFLRSTISLRSSYNVNQSKQLSQGQISDYMSQSIGFGSSFITRPSDYFNVDYNLHYGMSWNKIESNKAEMPTINTLSQKLKLNIFPNKKVIINFSCENFFNSMIESGSRWMWFGDIGIKYRLKGVDIMLDYNNLFDTRKYVSTSYSDIGRYLYSYKLRPSEVLLRVKFNIL